MGIGAFGIGPASKFATELQTPSEEPRPGAAFCLDFRRPSSSAPSIWDSLARRRVDRPRASTPRHRRLWHRDQALAGAGRLHAKIPKLKAKAQCTKNVANLSLDRGLGGAQLCTQ